MALTKVQSEIVSGGPSFSAYLSSVQNLSANTSTVVQFNSKEWDTAGCYNNTGSTTTLNGISVPAYAFAPNVAGYYQVNATVYYNFLASRGFCQILKNGSNYYKYGPDVTANHWSSEVNSPVYMNGTSDYIQILTYTSETSLYGAGQTYTYFNASLIRTA